jgi:4'-phosphopantetheinyl transferase
MLQSPIVWHSPPQNLPLPDRVIHLWRVWLDQPIVPVEQLRQLLAEDERGRADRFHFERDRQRFTVGRGTLRLLLSRYLQLEPDTLKFDYGDRGKPKLANLPDDRSIQFNLSHSHGLALYAFTRRHQIGVDVEQVRPIERLDQLANRFFSPQESAFLKTLAPIAQQEAFFRFWTSKEAYVKACGVGLSQPTQEIEISLKPGQEQLISIAEDMKLAEAWKLKLLIPAQGFIGAFVVESHDCQINYFDWAE